MSEPSVRGLIIAHSSLAAGLAAAVRQISGIGDDVLQTVSNDGQGPDALLHTVRNIAGEAPVILFTDLPSGSCAFTARKIAMERPETGIVCGVNLPVLLDFVFHRELPLPDLVDRLVEKGRGGISGAYTEEGARANRAVQG